MKLESFIYKLTARTAHNGCGVDSRPTPTNGVPQDKAQAHVWLNLAAAQGHELAAEIRETVAGIMTPADIAEAQRLAREWLEARQ